MTVIYLDSVFFLNGVLDYLLLLATARLADARARRIRFAIAALLGALYAAAVFLPHGEFLSLWTVKIAFGALIAVIAFWGEKRLFRLVLLFFLLSCAFAGSVLLFGVLTGYPIPAAGGVFYTDVDAKTLLLGASAAYLLLTLVFRAAASHGVRGEYAAVCVKIGGHEVRLTALCDTGNDLRDLRGEPILVVRRGDFLFLLPPHLQTRSDAELLEPLRRGRGNLRPLLLPYRTTLGEGVILTVQSEFVKVGKTVYPNARIALSTVDFGEGCRALWGGEGKEGRYESVDRETVAASGLTAPRGDPLHRRERRIAAAAEPRAGSGTAGAFGRGGSAQRTDRA